MKSLVFYVYIKFIILRELLHMLYRMEDECPIRFRMKLMSLAIVVFFATSIYANTNQCSNILTLLKDDPDTLFVQLDQNFMTQEMAEDLFQQLSEHFPGDSNSAFVRYQFQTKDLLEVAKRSCMLNMFT